MRYRSGVYRILAGKPEGKRQLGRSRCRSEDNVKMNLEEVGCVGADWIELTQYSDRLQALMNTVINILVP
jgi:hypothetical protein